MSSQRVFRMNTVSGDSYHSSSNAGSSRAMSTTSEHQINDEEESRNGNNNGYLYNHTMTEPYQPYVVANQLSDLTESAQNDHSSVICISDPSPRMDSMDGSRDIFSDLIRVEINDENASAANFRTITSLRNCKRQVLVPLWRLLQFVGWRSFGQNANNYYMWKVASIVYLVLILAFLTLAYIYQVLACQWRLDYKRLPFLTFGPPVIRPTTTPTANVTEFSAELYNLLSSGDAVTSGTLPLEPSGNKICDHVITSYILPNILHFIAYCMGFYHFRIQNNEELFALSEKVFLYSSPHAAKSTSQEKVIFRLKLFLAGGSVWMLTALATHLLYDFTYVVNSDSHLGLRIQGMNTICPLSATLLGMDTLGYLIICAVSIVIILNYAIHSEMIVHFVDTILARMYERNVPLKIAVQDIYQIRNAIALLNGTIATMTTLIIMLNAEMIIIGTSILLANTASTNLEWSFRAVFVLHLLPLVMFPLIQAARVNGHCHRLWQATLEMRTFGYCNASLLELDSVLLFMLANKSAWVKLFYIPLRPGFLIWFFALVAFTLILLMQTGVINISNYI